MTHSRPIIGIPTQTLQSLGAIPVDVPPSWVMSQRYIHALTAAGGLPWMIPLVGDDEETLRGIYEELDGVFLPGGADIDPTSYREERHPLCDRSDSARDHVELMLIRWAMADRKPVLGVCRGVQLINLAAGGTLYQDLADQYKGAIRHDYFPFSGEFTRDHLAHEVDVARNTKLAEIIGAGTIEVNSMHHQGIRKLGGCLIATAIAPDGLIEATESTNGSFLVGVQWHPEALTDRDDRMRRLFDAFVEASGEYRASRMVTA